MKYSDNELKRHFTAVYKKIGRPPKRGDLPPGGPSADTYVSRFGGSWKKVLESFGIFGIGKEEIYQEVLRIAKKLKRPITQEDFRNESRVGSLDFIKRNMGSWNKVKEELKLDAVRLKPLKKSEIIKEAKKFKTRSSFQAKSMSHYHAARRMGILEEACAHMVTVGSRYKRAIYAFEFDDKSVYVGLTYNYQERLKQHLLRNQLIRKKVRRRKYKFKKFNKWYPPQIAAIEEGKTILRYRRKGFVILNQIKHGGLGAGIKKWNKKSVLEVSKSFNSLKDFRLNAPGAYQHAHKHGFLDQITKGMFRSYQAHGYWTARRIYLEAKRYKSKSEFKMKSKGAYGAAVRLGIIKSVNSGFKPYEPQRRIWSESKILEVASKYTYMSKFKRENPGAALAAKELGIYGQISRKMLPEITPGYWTRERILKEAKRHKTRTDFMKNARGAYSAAKKLGIFELCCLHMV